MALLQVENLSFSYPEAAQPALQGVSLKIEAGEFAILCGASGCGKSTLLRLMKRELAPFGKQSGQIFYAGCPLEKLSDKQACAEVGFVQQRPESQIVTDRVWHELAFGLESLGVPQAEMRHRVCEMAAYFGIEKWFRQSTATLSGGQKQLLSLAGVMVMQPKLLLLDEPTAQLDPIAAADFIATLHKLNQELGVTVLMAEHRLEEALPLADRAVLMSGGKIDFNGEPRRLVQYFNQNRTHPMSAALPAAAKIYCALEKGEHCPLTVREGRRYLENHYAAAEFSVLKQKNTDLKPLLQAKGIWFRYEKNSPDVLQNVNLTVFKGEHLCLLGGNGAGKSTLLNLLSGVLRPYHGRVLLGNKPLSSHGGAMLYRQMLAVLPQDPQTVFLKKTVLEDLDETCLVMEYSSEEREQLVQQTAALLNISTLLQRHPFDLSGGEQQKVALAKLLLLKPKILLLDEPTKGIDPFAKQQLAAVLKKLNQSGVTVITVTHDVEFAAAHASRCAFLFGGEIVSTGTPNDFFSQNAFYTTAACRMARGTFKNAILCSEVIALCQKQSKKGGCSNAV